MLGFLLLDYSDMLTENFPRAETSQKSEFQPILETVSKL